MLAGLGYAEPPADRVSGFEVDLEQLRHLCTHDPSRSRWSNRDPSILRFWYRESALPLETWRFPFQYGNASRISPVDPPLALSSMALVRLDANGRLTHLVVVPPSARDGSGAAPPDWMALLARAGFDPPAWRTVAPERNPPSSLTPGQRGMEHGRTGPTSRCGSRPQPWQDGSCTSKRSIPGAVRHGHRRRC